MDEIKCTAPQMQACQDYAYDSGSEPPCPSQAPCTFAVFGRSEHKSTSMLAQAQHPVRAPLHVYAGTPAPAAPAAAYAHNAAKPQGFQEMLAASMSRLAIASGSAALTTPMPAPAAATAATGSRLRVGVPGPLAAARAPSAASSSAVRSARGFPGGSGRADQGVNTSAASGFGESSWERDGPGFGWEGVRELTARTASGSGESARLQDGAGAGSQGGRELPAPASGNHTPALLTARPARSQVRFCTPNVRAAAAAAGSPARSGTTAAGGRVNPNLSSNAGSTPFHAVRRAAQAAGARAGACAVRLLPFGDLDDGGPGADVPGPSPPGGHGSGGLPAVSLGAARAGTDGASEPSPDGAGEQGREQDMSEEEGCGGESGGDGATPGELRRQLLEPVLLDTIARMGAGARAASTAGRTPGPRCAAQPPCEPLSPAELDEPEVRRRETKLQREQLYISTDLDADRQITRSVQWCGFWALSCFL